MADLGNTETQSICGIAQIPTLPHIQSSSVNCTYGLQVKSAKNTGHNKYIFNSSNIQISDSQFGIEIIACRENYKMVLTKEYRICMPLTVDEVSSVFEAQDYIKLKCFD